MTVRSDCAPSDALWMLRRTATSGMPSRLPKRRTTRELSATDLSATTAMQVRLPTRTLPLRSRMRPRVARNDTSEVLFELAWAE